MRTQEKQFHDNLKKLMHELLLLICTQVEEKSSYQEILLIFFTGMWQHCATCKVLYTPLFSRTVIFADLARCGNSRGVNFAILLKLSLL